MSDNQPQVRTLEFRCKECRCGFHSNCLRVGSIGDCTCLQCWPQPTPAESRIETVPDVKYERACIAEYLSSKGRTMGDDHGIFESGWLAARFYDIALGRARAGAQPEEREAQAEAVNKIWNQFRSGDGEEDCELYRALEQAYGAGRARAGSSLRSGEACPTCGCCRRTHRWATIRSKSEAASPPSSPGAGQFVELWEAAQDFYASDSQWKESARDKARAHLGEVLKRTEPSDAMLLEVEKSSPVAPQEQK